VHEVKVVDLSAWRRGDTEPGGDEAKRWYTSPDDESRWLFKPAMTKELKLSKARALRGDSPDILRMGDDWAERVSFELATLLEIPAASSELAVVSTSDTVPVEGSISRDVRPRDWSRSSGAALIDEIDPTFDTRTCQGHRLDNIETALDGVLGPMDTAYVDWPAFDVFAGYLMFDAWIANTDRHAENWAVLQSPQNELYLAPSYDHGSALGAGMREENFLAALAEGVGKWAGKGEAGRFAGYRDRTLVQLANDAMSRTNTAARVHWKQSIADVSLRACNDAIAATPRMSDAARMFVLGVLTVNKERLCDAW